MPVRYAHQKRKSNVFSNAKKKRQKKNTAASGNAYLSKKNSYLMTTGMIPIELLITD